MKVHLMERDHRKLCCGKPGKPFTICRMVNKAETCRLGETYRYSSDVWLSGFVREEFRQSGL